jgi:hypothetical protein
MYFKLARVSLKLSWFFHNIGKFFINISDYFQEKENYFYRKVCDSVDVVRGVPEPEIIPFRNEAALRIAKGINLNNTRDRVLKLLVESEQKICGKLADELIKEAEYVLKEFEQSK